MLGCCPQLTARTIAISRRDAGAVAARGLAYLRSIEQRLRTAELEWAAESARAEEAVRRRDFTAALDALKWALELDSNEGEFYALRGWVLFLQQQDQGNRNTEPALEQIKKAITLSPQSPAPFYYLAQIRKACGDQAEAEKMFRKTVELRPDHIEANRELRLIQMRRAKGDETVSGRLFGRKKK